MWTIAGLTFKETARKRILLLTVISTLVFLFLYGIALHYASLQADNVAPKDFQSWVIPQMLTAGLFFSSMIVSMLAIFSGSGAVSGDIETGVMHGVLTRPLRRSELVLGKFIGSGAMLLLYGIFLYSSIMLLVYFLMGYKAPGAVSAGLFFLMQPMVLLSLATLGTTFLTTMANGIAVFILYGMSILGGIVELIGSTFKNDALVNLGIASSLLAPVDVMYRKTVAVLFSASSNPLAGLLTMGPFGVQAEPSHWMTLYAAFYCLFMLGAALRIFGRKDI